jgi:hypothetical protein
MQNFYNKQILKMKAAVIILLAATFFAGCGKSSYKKTPGGMPYKLYRGKDTQQVVAGSYIKLFVHQTINDSVLLSTEKGVPIYLFVDNQRMGKYDISELWTSLHLGDSVVAVQMMDTFIKRSPASVPPQFKNGDRVITRIKVLGIFMNDSLARIDEEQGRKVLLAKEVAEIEKYLADKKINAQKNPIRGICTDHQPGFGKPGRFRQLYYDQLYRYELVGKKV